MWPKLRDTVLAILIPYLLFALLGLLTGSLDLGTPELTIILLLQILGLLWVWVVGPLRARRLRH
jgi:hypothetical protein